MSRADVVPDSAARFAWWVLRFAAAWPLYAVACWIMAVAFLVAPKDMRRLMENQMKEWSS